MRKRRNKSNKLLLHICCGPCSIYVFNVLSSEFKVQSFFYNPNIHPKEEYLKRKKCLKEYTQHDSLQVIWGKYEPRKYFEKVLRVTEVTNVTKITKEIEKGKINVPKEIRCPVCYRLRLEKTAYKASKLGFDYFTTTLLQSPYQDLKKIKEIGDKQAKKYGVKFYFEDFTSGFRSGQQKAKEFNLYRQKYCGCIFSKFKM